MEHLGDGPRCQGEETGIRKGFGIGMRRDRCCVTGWGPVHLPRRAMAVLEKYCASETQKVG